MLRVCRHQERSSSATHSNSKNKDYHRTSFSDCRQNVWSALVKGLHFSLRETGEELRERAATSIDYTLPPTQIGPLSVAIVPYYGTVGISDLSKFPRELCAMICCEL